MLPQLQFVFPGPLTPNAPPDTYNGLGKNDQILSVVPSEGLVVVRMGEAASPDGPAVPTTFVNEMWGLLRKVICVTTSVEDVEIGSAGGLIKLNGSGPYIVVDMLGRVVAKSTSKRVDLGATGAGVYFVVDVANNTLTVFRR